ncbi:hypothetical protein [Wolbachia endosymbiont (group A) of Pogonocherus hispidulus]|uniref:hypothetical protein n=1 Tax=Wolbachia endosymbiont (group A) of Pogonocherus hispidulus TaxID=3066136 RepID=UPI003341BF0A
MLTDFFVIYDNTCEYPCNNVATNIKLKKIISRQLLLKERGVVFTYRTNDQLTICFDE